MGVGGAGRVPCGWRACLLSSLALPANIHCCILRAAGRVLERQPALLEADAHGAPSGDVGAGQGCTFAGQRANVSAPGTWHLAPSMRSPPPPVQASKVPACAQMALEAIQGGMAVVIGLQVRGVVWCTRRELCRRMFRARRPSSSVVRGRRPGTSQRTATCLPHLHPHPSLLHPPPLASQRARPTQSCSRKRAAAPSTIWFRR